MIKSKEIGRILREARAKKGLGVEEVSKNTRIQGKIIENIEEGIFDKLSKVYVKSFIKKYAAFLGVNVQEISNKFDSLYEKRDEAPSKEPKKQVAYKSHRMDAPAKVKEGRSIRENIDTILMPGRETVRKGAEILSKTSDGIKKNVDKSVGTIKSAFSPDKIKKFVITVSSVAAMTAFFLVIIICGGKIFNNQDKKRFESVKKITPPSLAKITAPKSVEAAKPVITAKPAAGAVIKPVKVTLSATGEVWIRVFAGDSTVFVGTLKEGDVRTFNSESGYLTVWTGKGENLLFAVNNKDVGKVADGVVRDIKISNEGIRSSGQWVKKF